MFVVLNAVVFAGVRLLFGSLILVGHLGIWLLGLCRSQRTLVVLGLLNSSSLIDVLSLVNSTKIVPAGTGFPLHLCRRSGFVSPLS